MLRTIELLKNLAASLGIYPRSPYIPGLKASDQALFFTTLRWSCRCFTSVFQNDIIRNMVGRQFYN